ncbi:MAG: valine--tRNA ligase [Terracidiphilus sp.]|nr:valine--tRNA ligase [Terracidiphilus sp.]MDR3798571.1 valine--tRNA ligase [Terracidiphilus sp.]
MPHDLPKAYDPTAIEDHWAGYWVRENLFAVSTPTELVQNQCLDGKSPFTILLPPPNVTGRLHMGHMLNQTEMDILTRWRRMSGRLALWVPGTDHAGIATQMMVERQLTEEGTSRQTLGREAFVERVWAWKSHYGGAILEQMKRLGVSVDWSREYFTMDERLSVAVREAFVRLYAQGLIYRGAYIVNWCPRCQTAISDLEVVHQEQKGHLWEIRYSVLDSFGRDSGEYITVATTRPETMLGDTAVAIHPEDERYLHLHGKKLRLPLMDREIPIVVDPWVSREFGTGAVKVTPAHDPNDFAIGERHHLPSINVMDDRAHINENGGPYQGLDRYVARKKIVADLEAQGLLGAIKDYTNNVGHCDRCKTVVEPRLSTQWFIAVNKEPNGGGESMAEKARAAVRADSSGKKAIRFTPENYEKIYLNWMDDIHDWCISRQLWWGHRIPAWHCGVCHKITVPEPGATGDPAACAHCGSDKITQETDVLDTWFSSGLLPVSVFGWPNITPETRADFDAFYPTSLLVTGFDILFFWVARMIMLGCWFAGDVPLPDGSPRRPAETVPFREVYIHALVRDANREKMSKTKGNVIDPIEIVKQYGTDAVRFTLASMASPGTDIAFNVARTEGYRAFANKIWNAARFIFMNVDRAAEVGIRIERRWFAAPPLLTNESRLEDLWIMSRFCNTAKRVNEALEKYRFDDAANVIYQFFWGEFCDWYLEIVKLRLNFNESLDNSEATDSLATLLYVFQNSLRLLSPFMPFLTEEIWHALYEGMPPRKSIALTSYPQFEESYLTQVTYPSAETSMEHLVLAITSIRSRRKDLGIEDKVLVKAKVASSKSGVLRKNRDILLKLARLEDVEVVLFSERDSDDRYKNLAWQAFGHVDVYLDYQKEIDVAAERERLTKDIAKYEKGLAAAERQLGNEAFLAKAPVHVVEGLKEQEAETRLLLEKTIAALETLPKE